MPDLKAFVDQGKGVVVAAHGLTFESTNGMVRWWHLAVVPLGFVFGFPPFSSPFSFSLATAKLPQSDSHNPVRPTLPDCL